ncbi:FAS-associated factor 2-B [Zancudomyces culisetae]|uniref:FAS-associated factor 2-B n=1 Tax=Zancudomyces culisetae TaxID=1213189 RepID=A0A1R1PT87_ZANCU|nr:FAS-associated factor 2-B [Zancudomyces culisetae]|eukprot:OMH84180.1 FAS-associated factor 2-B [Zancudomyces culisetae]
MSVIARMDGLPLSSYNPDDAEAGVQAGTNQLVDWMSLPISAHDRVLQTARLEQEERERTRVLREQQDAAYVASLERDRIREQELQRKQLEEQERTRKKEARRSVRLEARDRRRLWRLHTYNKYFAGDEPTGDNICTLTFRLSNGTRIRRKFSGDDPIERIYAFIESSFLSDDEKLKDSPLSLKLTEVLQSSSRNNLEERPATFHFLLVTTFPRREIYPSKDPIRPALEAVKMWPSGAFIAEPTGDDSDLSSEDEGDGENEGVYNYNKNIILCIHIHLQCNTQKSRSTSSWCVCPPSNSPYKLLPAPIPTPIPAPAPAPAIPPTLSIPPNMFCPAAPPIRSWFIPNSPNMFCPGFSVVMALTLATSISNLLRILSYSTKRL